VSFFSRCSLIVVILGCTAWQFAQNITFKEEVKLVEVYATVLDHKGHEVDGLTKDQFEVRDDGKVQRIRVFEPASGALSCALLLDITGSMTFALPAVKNGARQLIDSLRPEDSVGVYAFTEQLDELQQMSTDHAASKRALTELYTGGRTALFDSITQLAIDMEQRPGKKVIVVLTDGGDNASVLNRYDAAERAKNSGVPVFAIAEGEALHDGAAASLLGDLARATGGAMYKANHSKDIESAFEEIGRQVRNGYLLAFRPGPNQSKSWHEIQVVIKNTTERLRVQARGGYSFE